MSDNKNKLIDPLEYAGSIDQSQLTDVLYEVPEDEPDKTFEQKRYIILYICNEESSDFNNHYMICNGRTETYDFIKANIDEIDIHDSFILTETKQTETKTGRRRYYITSLDSAISVLDFMRKVQDNYKDGFDINDYDYSFDANPDEINHNIISSPEFQIAKEVASTIGDRLNKTNQESIEIDDDDNDENSV